jgi:RNA polymerase sigma-70 factor, ECF subfamily
MVANEERVAESFEDLVRRYQERVFRLAISILGVGREQDAEEVAQDAFLSAYRALAGFRGDSSFSTWIYRITYNTALNRRKSLQSRRHQVAPEYPSPPTPLHQAIEGNRREVLHQAMEELPDLYRTALHLHYWLGCPVEEIAEYLSAPPGTVKSYLHRGRARLSAILSKKGITE